MQISQAVFFQEVADLAGVDISWVIDVVYSQDDDYGYDMEFNYHSYRDEIYSMVLPFHRGDDVIEAMCIVVGSYFDKGYVSSILVV